MTDINSFGTVGGVAAYVGVYTINGAFNTETVPAALTVQRWLDQVSDMFNLALDNAGFETPITVEDAVSALTMVTEQLVADLAHAANSKGRLITRGNGASANMMQLLQDDIIKWIEMNSQGLENSGVPRTQPGTGRIATKGFDSQGHQIVPIFQRNAFGNHFEDWSRS